MKAYTKRIYILQGGYPLSQGLLHHIEIYVSDLKSSVAFWGWLLEELV
ncbi:hypothetical protein Cphy_3359 [Lachnoclostridium phytofermentans ISDg]|uniref:Uncharacterized protein n=1 Tax=Lachnoclostridium phytofermentans (strain ATCC 700394 / DSM 18823 / ISDg) TaxID=357809 RepID=A9KT82_LACP7|nr:hypothetical protein Cphy_3359 [Lachnoclostridium phytofermentans ISDg]